MAQSETRSDPLPKAQREGPAKSLHCRVILRYSINLQSILHIYIYMYYIYIYTHMSLLHSIIILQYKPHTAGECSGQVKFWEQFDCLPKGKAQV